MTSGQHVFITGGSGFIGSRVVRQLLERDLAAHVLMRPHSSHTHRLRDLPVATHPGDLTDPESLETGMRECHAAIHLAAPSAWTDLHATADTLETQLVDGVRSVVTAAARAGVRRLIHVSSLVALDGSDAPRILDESALPEPESCALPYSRAKRRAECWLADHAPANLEVVIVLPGEVYGPEDDDLITAGTLLQALRMRPLLACRGGASVVHVDDVAAGIVAALERGRPGERYILGGGNLTIAQILRIAAGATGAPRRVWTLPNRLVHPATTLLAAVPFLATPPREILDYATRYWWGDSTKARRKLRYAPRPPEEAIAAAVQWLLTSGRLAPPK